MFKLLSPSKYSPLMQYTYQDVFSTAQNSFWTCRFWCLLVLLPFFVSPLPHWQNICIWGLFSSRKQKRSHSGWDQMNREGRAWGSCHFVSKITEHSVHWGQVRSSITPIVERANTLKEFSKKFCRSQMQPLTTRPAGTLTENGLQIQKGEREE